MSHCWKLMGIAGATCSLWFAKSIEVFHDFYVNLRFKFKCSQLTAMIYHQCLGCVFITHAFVSHNGHWSQTEDD